MSDKVVSADTVVIGAGLAGTVAALAAGADGKEVCVVHSDKGASGLNSGALDLCGDPCRVAGRPEKTCRETERNIKELLSRNQYHPYNLLAGSDSGAQDIIALFKKALGLIFPGPLENSLAGSAEQATPFANNLGTFKFSCFAFKHAAALDDPALERPVAVGFSELVDFDPGYWIKSAGSCAQLLGIRMEPAGAMTINLGMGKNLSTVELARHLEHEGCREEFIESIVKNKDGLKNASAAVMPAMLPLSAREEILARLSEQTGVRFFELISLPPSAPGLRLAETLSARLDAESIRVLQGRVAGFKAEGAKIISLDVDSFNRRLSIEGSRFIIASGAYIGGGLKKNPDFRETVFGLPVFCQDEFVSRIFTEKLTRASIRGPHPLFSVGVKVDRSLRPLDRDGAPVFENLRAAGALLAGSDYAGSGTGAGTALCTGYRAAKD